MPFDWKQYLSLADELSKRSEEAALRSAVSRAYYAAFPPSAALITPPFVPPATTFAAKANRFPTPNRHTKLFGNLSSDGGRLTQRFTRTAID